MRAGVFDSGVGGLTVVKSLLDHHVFSEIIYYGDTARVPYGPKDKNTIIRYALEALEFFKNFHIDIMIAACNTVSSYAIDKLRENATFPVEGVIQAGVLATKNRLADKQASVLVLGTQATIASNQYQQQLRSEGFEQIRSITPGLFVPLVEEGIVEGAPIDAAMDHYFGTMETPDALILGCTHYPLLAPALARRFGGTQIIHSGEAIVEHLQQHYDITRRYAHCKLELFASDNPDSLKHVAKRWLHS